MRLGALLIQGARSSCSPDCFENNPVATQAYGCLIAVMNDVAIIKDAKAALRIEASRRRARLDPARREASARDVATAGLPFLDLSSGRVIAGYRAIGEEFDPLPLLETLLGQGHTIVLPVVKAPRMPLIFRRWQPGDRLEMGAFDVLVPTSDKPTLEPDILLVPMLTFDRSGYRLGYGAGFYDRTIARLRVERTVAAVGLAFAEQEIDAVPHDAFDERLDWVVTPNGPYRIER
ncbi:MAG: 5-formyltetrahydrofolate cyclo-ligase [Methyloligellaceae bacterium]